MIQKEYFSVKDNKFTYTLLLTTVFLILISLTSLSIGVAVSIGVASVWYAIHKPEWLLLFLIAFIPFEPFLLKFVPSDFYVFARYGSETLIYLLFIVLVLRRITRNGSAGSSHENTLSTGPASQSQLISRPPSSIFDGNHARPASEIVFDENHPPAIPKLYVTFIALFIISLLSLLINAVPVDVGILGLRQIFRFVLLFFVTTFLFSGFRFQVSGFMKVFFSILFVIVFIQSVLGIAQSLSGGRLDEFLLPGERKTIGAIQLTTGTRQFWEEGQRVFGTMGRYDQLGSFLAIMLLMIVAFLYERVKIMEHETHNIKLNNTETIVENVSRFTFYVSRIMSPKLLTTNYLLLTILVLGIITLILTYSRASWIAFLAGLFVIAVVIKRDKKVIAGFLIALIAFSAVYFSSGKIMSYLIDSPRQTLSERVFEAASPSRWMGEYYGLGRMFFIINTPSALITHAPLYGMIGMGPGTFGGGVAQALHYTKSYGILGLPFGIWNSEGHIDNNWFSLLGEIGFLGVAAYLAILGLLGMISIRLYCNSADPLYRAVGLGYCGVLTAFFVLGFFAMYFEMRTLAPYVWMIGGIVITNYE